MRKLIVGLVAVAFLALAAAPVKAQTADPLGLIASGAVIPYVGATGIAVVNSATGAISPTDFRNVGSLAILEVAAPVGSADFHMFFFDQSCARVGPSVGNSLTVNEANLLNLNLISNIPSTGLIAAGSTNSTGNVLVPLNGEVHARVYWINAVDGVLSRVLEPISASNPEAPTSNLWNPLRSGATFVAPLEGSGVRSTLYLACPTQNVIPGVFPSATGSPFSAFTAETISNLSGTIPVGDNQTAPFAPSGTAFICQSPTLCTDAFTYTSIDDAAFEGVAGVAQVYPAGTRIVPFPIDLTSASFPLLDPAAVPGTGNTPLFLRVYDDEERFIRDVNINCRCWGAHPVADIDVAYSNPLDAPRGTYTEIEGRSGCISSPSGVASACSFTGYRTIQWGAGVVGNDVFGRLSNASRSSLRGGPPAPGPSSGR